MILTVVNALQIDEHVRYAMPGSMLRSPAFRRPMCAISRDLACGPPFLPAAPPFSAWLRSALKAPRCCSDHPLHRAEQQRGLLPGEGEKASS